MSYVNNMSYVYNMIYVCRLHEFYELCKSYENFFESLKIICFFVFNKIETFLLIYKDGKPKL